MNLVASKQFATTDATKPGGVLEEPTFFSERDSFHSVATGLPVNRSQEFRREVMFTEPVLLSTVRKDVVIEMTFVNA